MIQRFPLGGYVKLVDYTGRLFRQGKALISAELAEIFERLGCSAPSWQRRLEMLHGDRLLGRFSASTRAKLREIGGRLGVRHLVIPTGCPIRLHDRDSWIALNSRRSIALPRNGTAADP
jgi:hypothetical protein